MIRDVDTILAVEDERMAEAVQMAMSAPGKEATAYSHADKEAVLAHAARLKRQAARLESRVIAVYPEVQP